MMIKPGKRARKAEAAMLGKARKPDRTRPDKTALVQKLREAARREPPR